LILVNGKEHDLGGGFRVNRLLPSAGCRSVGPWIFMDHFGPVDVRPGMNIDVRPHPHIGLATVTWLFEGALMHRDSVGSGQRIEPGAINWMTAGRGIVHSERTPGDLKAAAWRAHGLQLWIGLPRALEEAEPAFHHLPAASLPDFAEQGARTRLLVGSGFGRVSPVPALSPTLFLVIELPAGAGYTLPPLAQRSCVYPVNGGISVDALPVPARTLAVLDAGSGCRLVAQDAVTVAVLGGDALDGERQLWWNFAASDPARIRRAADDWEQGRFAKIEGEEEFIPLPRRPDAWATGA
jgi:redox-sensitive bicupin YhaK (pirin superfamily)